MAEDFLGWRERLARGSEREGAIGGDPQHKGGRHQSHRNPHMRARRYNTAGDSFIAGV